MSKTSKAKRQHIKDYTEMNPALPISLILIECICIFAALFMHLVYVHNELNLSIFMLTIIVFMFAQSLTDATHKELKIQNNKTKFKKYIKRLNTIDKLYVLCIVANLEIKALLFYRLLRDNNKSTVVSLIILSIIMILLLLIRFFPIGAMLAVMQDNETIIEEKEEPLNKKREINLVKYISCYIKYLVNRIGLRTRLNLVETIIYVVLFLTSDINRLVDKLVLTIIYSIASLATYLFINKRYDDSNNLDNRLGERINKIYCKKMENRQRAYDKVEAEIEKAN